MSLHVRVVAGLYLAFGALFVLGAVFSSVTFGFLAHLAGTTGDAGAPLGVALLGLTGLALTITLLLVGAPSILCGWGLLKFRRWGRVLGIILAAIAVIQFPLGTIFGVYALWVLFQKRTEHLFEPGAVNAG